MQKKRIIKIISIVLIFVLICVSITYFKNNSKVVLATTKEFNTENLQDNEHMHVEIDSSGDKVPVPNGYVGSKATGENEIDTGYVIYEGTEEVNDSNVEEAQKTRNQYVWIPVPDASTMYGTDANGKKWGKLYEFTTSTGNNIDSVTGAKPLNWSESNGEMKITTKTSYREPDIVENYEPNGSGYDVNSKLKNLGIGSHQFLIQLEGEFSRMIESVEKYSGFYIGRYETGNLNKELAVVTKGNENISGQTWYVMYKKCKNLKKDNKNVETGILWGTQWDRTLMWLIESGNKTKDEISMNSTSWGNYNKVSLEYVNNKGDLIIKEKEKEIKIPTGSSEYTRTNNVYDLAGNVLDRTMESFSTSRRTRGGAYNDNKGNASSRIGHLPTVTYGYVRMSCNAIYKVKQEIANNFKKWKY